MEGLLRFKFSERHARTSTPPIWRGFFLESQKIAASGSPHVGAAEGCDLLIYLSNRLPTSVAAPSHTSRPNHPRISSHHFISLG